MTSVSSTVSRTGVLCLLLITCASCVQRVPWIVNSEAPTPGAAVRGIIGITATARSTAATSASTTSASSTPASATSPQFETRTERGGPLTALAWSHNGRWIVAGGADVLRIYSASTFQIYALLYGHVGAITTACWSPNDEEILSGGADGSVRRWQWRKSTASVVHRHRGGVLDVGWSPDSAWMASCGIDRRVQVLHSTRDTSISFDDIGMQALAWTVEGIAGDDAGAPQDARSGVSLIGVTDDEWVVQSFFDGQPARRFMTFERPRRGEQRDSTPLLSIAVHGEPRFIAVSSQVSTSQHESRVEFWSLGGKKLASVPSSAQPARALAWSPDGALLAIGRSTLELWDVKGEPLRVFPPRLVPTRLDRVVSASWSADSQRIAVGHVNGDLSVWSADGDLQRVLHAHPTPINDITSFGTTASPPLSSGDSGAAGSAAGIAAAAVEPGNNAVVRKLVASCRDGSVFCWGADGELRWSFPADGALDVSVDWSDDGRQLAIARAFDSSTRGGSLEVWIDGLPQPRLLTRIVVGGQPMDVVWEKSREDGRSQRVAVLITSTIAEVYGRDGSKLERVAFEAPTTSLQWWPVEEHPRAGSESRATAEQERVPGAARYAIPWNNGWCMPLSQGRSAFITADAEVVGESEQLLRLQWSGEELELSDVD